MKKLIFTILLAAVLWTVMFSPWTAPFVNFWWMMTGSALTLSVFATLFNPGWWREVKWSLPNVLLGLGIAVALWGVFWLGDKVSSWMFDFARPQVDSIYGMKEGESPWLLAALLLLLIGPAEEIFWRGYVQRTLSKRWNPNAGFVVATLIYALVHAGSCNFMLVMAALVVVRNMEKCILCRRCETVCNQVQTVGALSVVGRGFTSVLCTAFNDPILTTNCVNCGQCVAVCPTSALSENSNIREVMQALADPGKTVVVQTAPAVRVALGQDFGLEGRSVTGKMTTALRRLGFDYVFDTDFAADLTIMEEGTELLQRLNKYLAGEIGRAHV